MKRLTAQRPILYGGRMYQAGDTLPAYDKRPAGVAAALLRLRVFKRRGDRQLIVSSRLNHGRCMYVSHGAESALDPA